MNAATLKLFSDPHVLRQIGRPLLTEFFERFTHLLPSKYLLPNPRPDNEAYFDSLAHVLACTSELPDGLAQALFEVEALAVAKDRDNDPQITDATPISQAIQSWLVSHAEKRSRTKDEKDFGFADKDSFARLALLSPTDYDRCRKAEARRLGIRVETLDSEVAKHRQLSDEAGALNSALSTLNSPLVWPEPVDGAQVLDLVAARFSFYVKLPVGAADALALWDAHAHAFAAFPLSPRLNLSSSESGCGKTTTLDLLAAMTPRPLRTESLTAPVLFRLVDQQQPTLLLDEVDTFLTQDEELRGLLNAGHKRGGCAYRCEGSNNSVRAFEAFAPAVLSGIGPLPATLHDRSICIYLLKAEEDEVTAHFNELKAEIETELCRKLARWTQDNFGAIQACDPPMPKAAFNRLGDNWRPLFAIAQIAGGGWPERVLSAFTQLSGPSNASSPPLSSTAFAKSATAVKKALWRAGQPNGFHNSLLGDVRDIFAKSGVSRISSKQLVEALCALPERPDYSALHNPRSSCRWLALRLAHFDIHPHNIQVDGRQSKGYDLRDFATTFSQLSSQMMEGMSRADCARENLGGARRE